MVDNQQKKKALETAVTSIERQFGKGSIMRLGDSDASTRMSAIPPARSVWITPWVSAEFRAGE